MTYDIWLEKHPYLRRMADFHKAIEETLAVVSLPTVCIPAWGDYVSDFHSGIPLLRSDSVAIDLQPTVKPILTVAGILASKSLPAKLTEKIQDLYTELQMESHRIVNTLLGQHSFTPTHPGLFRYLGWTVLARCLRDLVTAFGLWRDEESWLRPYCPTCGGLPAMAQLIGVDQGRKRILCCGYCGTHWNYPRVGCPFCENVDDQRLGHLGLEGEGVMRIDYCENCGGYLKTYNGEGREALFLADWTSLHLDIMACDRGLNRLADSRYQLL